jgi:hypothetical protein
MHSGQSITAFLPPVAVCPLAQLDPVPPTSIFPHHRNLPRLNPAPVPPLPRYLMALGIVNAIASGMLLVRARSRRAAHRAAARGAIAPAQTAARARSCRRPKKPGRAPARAPPARAPSPQRPPLRLLPPSPRDAKLDRPVRGHRAHERPELQGPLAAPPALGRAVGGRRVLCRRRRRAHRDRPIRVTEPGGGRYALRPAAAAAAAAAPAPPQRRRRRRLQQPHPNGGGGGGGGGSSRPGGCGDARAPLGGCTCCMVVLQLWRGFSEPAALHGTAPACVLLHT